MKRSQQEQSSPPPMGLTLKISPMLLRVTVIIMMLFCTWLMHITFKDSFLVLENRLGSLSWTLNSDRKTESRLSIIAIDEKSLSQVGPWPWPRETLAKLATALDTAGVSLQMYDIVFPESKVGDEKLIQTLKNTPSVIAQVPVMNSEQRLQKGSINQNITGMRCQQPLPNTHNYLANHGSFSAISKGHITPVLDPDGAINSMAPLICVEGQVYPSLALSGLLKGLNIQDPKFKITPGNQFLSSPWLIEVEQYPELAIPIDAQGNMRISYRKHPNSYQVISAADVLNNQVDPSLLENSWVQVGATAFGLGDNVPTPYSGMTPGVELQARLITSLLDNDAPYTPRIANYLMLLMTLVFAFTLYILTTMRGKVAIVGLPVAALLLSLLAWVIHAQLLIQTNIWLGWTPPALFAILASTSLSLLEHNRSRIAQARVYSNLNSYLPSDTADKIAYNLPIGTVEVEHRQCVLLNADIRNFSAYGESTTAETSVTLLHNFFVTSCRIIEKNLGVVQELKGDSLIAIWPCKLSKNALAASDELQREISKLLLTCNLPDIEPLALGIGIEQGDVLIGSIGPEHNRTHSILGKTVTKVLRIQEMTADLAHPILIGPNAARHLGENSLESQGDYLLAGLQQPSRLYAPLIGRMDEKDDSTAKAPKLKLLQGNAH
jgi:CHASE2 domain-containing sensor protein/class 3 adenylate cyclase